MCCNCREPINCYDDKTRYKVLVVLYIIDIIGFIIRLSLVSNDISKQTQGTMQFLVPVLLFDLFASVPVILCNIIYVILRIIGAAVGTNSNSSSNEHIWQFATITCCRLKCHKDRPQAILLMRLIMLLSSFVLKFMCFTIAAACSARFKSEGTAYTVIAAFAMIASMLCLIVEFVNFFRVWKYNPTETENSSNSSRVGLAEHDPVIKKFHRRFLGFIHYSLLNDQNAKRFRQSRCEAGGDCRSLSLHHHLFYHCLEDDHAINLDLLKDYEKKAFIAFYQTTKKEAFEIAKSGFPYGDHKNLKFKDYLHLKKGIFFSRSCKANFESKEATICVTINLGRITELTEEAGLDFDHYFSRGDGECDTLYVKSTKKFYLRMPAQIESWIITINEGVIVNDPLDGMIYQPCL